MNPKQKNINMHKLFCLSSLLLENLDELNPTNLIVKKYKEDLIGFCEHLNNTVSDTSTVQKSTYFHEITKKIDTILRKNFDDRM